MKHKFELYQQISSIGDMVMSLSSDVPSRMKLDVMRLAYAFCRVSGFCITTPTFNDILPLWAHVNEDYQRVVGLYKVSRGHSHSILAAFNEISSILEEATTNLLAYENMTTLDRWQVTNLRAN